MSEEREEVDVEGSPKDEIIDDFDEEDVQDADELLERKDNNFKDSGKKTTAKLEESAKMRRELNRLKSGRLLQSPSSFSTAPASWIQQRDCLLLILESRMVLKEMIQLKLKQERIKNGNLSASEIQNLLRNQKDEQESDWITEIQELKRNLVSEVRRNHVLERELNKLDKRIALLIKNRGNIQEVLIHHNPKKRAATLGDGSKQDIVSDPRKLEHYQNLFYLLQTEPKYLANLVYLMNADKMESFLDTVILTLYGDAFSPREEYLILKLFQISIQKEMSAIKDVSGFLQADSVVPRMVITYNRRKQGTEYLKNLLGPLIKSVISKDVNLELKPSQIYNAMISDIEISTGEKSNLERNLSEEQMAEVQEVATVIKSRVSQLESICQSFVDGIVQNLNKIPYGIRWICKQIRLISEKNFKENSDSDILKVTGYFVYYRFINVALVSPESFEILDRELSLNARKNLIVVSKVLQKLFNLSVFGNSNQDKWFTPLNDFIKRNYEKVRDFFTDLIEVADPDDYLQVDKYMELTQKTKPLIIISINEIAMTHNYLSANAAKLAADKEDPLRLILNDLGEVPGTREDDREIQLTLTNRFKTNMEEEISASASLYVETKELIISTFRLIPVGGDEQDQSLLGILNSGRKFAKEKNNLNLSSQIERILDNIKILEAEQLITKDDNYASFLRDIALEVANRAQIREQQRKEIKRLTQTLKNLRKHQSYLNEQIGQYNDYLQDCRLKHYQPKTKKKKSKEGDNKIGPFKFSYGALQKKGVIIDSDVPVISRKKTNFYISSEEVGVFDIVAKIAGLAVEKMTLELDDLLERNYNGIQKLELDQVTLDVNFTIHLINKFFLK